MKTLYATDDLGFSTFAFESREEIEANLDNLAQLTGKNKRPSYCFFTVEENEQGLFDDERDQQFKWNSETKELTYIM